MLVRLVNLSLPLFYMKTFYFTEGQDLDNNINPIRPMNLDLDGYVAHPFYKLLFLLLITLLV